jgi:hypothetical protein
LSESAQINLLGARLSGAAFTAYMGMSQRGALRELSLEGFISLLEGHFGDPDQQSAARTRWQKDRQGGDSVAAYAARMHSHLAFLNDVSPAAQVHRFADGLTAEVKRVLVLQMHTFTDLDSVVSAAHRVEQLMGATKPKAALHAMGGRSPPPRFGGRDQRRWRGNGRRGGMRFSGTGRGDQGQGWQPRDAGSGPARWQHGRGSGSAGRQQPSRRHQALVPGNDGQSRPEVQCYSCRDWGHYADKCPRPGNRRA